jgi:hypothetical protein
MTEMIRFRAKAQLSVEMIILLSALLIILMVIISSFSNSPSRSFLSKRTMSARETAERLAYGLNNLYLAGDGASQSIILPPTLLDGTNYTITIYPAQRLVEIRWQSSKDIMTHYGQILTSGISGKLSGITGTVNLTNINNTIVIQN